MRDALYVLVDASDDGDYGIVGCWNTWSGAQEALGSFAPSDLPDADDREGIVRIELRELGQFLGSCKVLDVAAWERASDGDGEWIRLPVGSQGDIGKESDEQGAEEVRPQA